MALTADMKAFVRLHENEDIHSLILQARKYPRIDMNIAIRQIRGRLAAKQKLPLWHENDDILYPEYISLEQCSSQPTALYKLSLFSGDTMIDLTGGLGVDTSFLSHNFRKVVYVERNKALAEITECNFKTLGLNHIEVVVAEAENYIGTIDDRVDLIYIDPARRDDIGKKVVKIEDCSPNLLLLENVLKQKANKVLIKYSPMLDISQAVKELSNISEVHIVSYMNECKELLFVQDRSVENPELTYRCINIKKDGSDDRFVFRREDEHVDISYTPNIGKYLYEPNTSILKAGAYKSIAHRYKLSKLHANSHLYTSDNLVVDFPGRIFEVQDAISMNKQELKKTLTGITHANITVRNFPLTVDDLRKRLKLKDGGSTYIFATTTSDNSKILILCAKH